MNPSIGAISKWKYLLLLKLIVFRDPIREFFEMIGPRLERLELNHIENIDKQFIVQVISFKKINCYFRIYLEYI